MTINDVRENDLCKIIKDLNWEYTRKLYELEYEFKMWSERGEPIKTTVLDSARALFNMAERNLDYINLLVNQYKSMGYLESKELNDTMNKETFFYKAELIRLRQLKAIVPLVKPIAQLRNKKRESL